MPKLIDITYPIDPTLAVWPGDTPYSHQWGMAMARGDSVNVSTLILSAHTGTHADAPLHFDPAGQPIGTVHLAPYIGPAQVILITHLGPITPDDLDAVDLTLASRLLIKAPTASRPPNQWPAEITYPMPQTVEYLAQSGIILFGTDAPSVDPLDSKTLEAHHCLARHGIAILESLCLAHVQPGLYELIALPLALPVDGSPVRAILRTL